MEYIKAVGFIEEKDRVCGNCQYYHQHYTKVGGQYMKINCGHCVYPRVKTRKASNHCEYFSYGD